MVGGVTFTTVLIVIVLLVEKKRGREREKKRDKESDRGGERETRVIKTGLVSKVHEASRYCFVLENLHARIEREIDEKYTWTIL